jgi:hypothetical protein
VTFSVSSPDRLRHYKGQRKTGTTQEPVILKSPKSAAAAVAATLAAIVATAEAHAPHLLPGIASSGRVALARV